jgi:vacuolar-type H+-ATPase subunit H
VEDKTLKELEFHQETVATDANSPLHLIREKEMEISGRVLDAKQEAEEIVAKARKQAVETVQKAEAEGVNAAEAEEADIRAQVEKDVADIEASTEKDKEVLRALISEKADEAVSHVVAVVKHV